ncbi:MAG: hypothetical protein Q8M29_01285 [Bacteroidota bacterium]|nr:hypothetical protein [Bacteroidota bacterium]
MSKVDFFKDLVFKTNVVAGLEIVALSDSSFVYNIQVLEKKGKNLEPKNSYTQIKDKSQVFKTLKELKCPVIINYQGKGTIQRAFQDSIKENFTDALNRLIPSANENEFHIQIYNSNTGNSFACILRKQQLNELQKEFEEKKIDIIGVLLGNYHLELLLPIMNQGGSMNRIVTAEHSLLFEDGGLKEITARADGAIGDSIELGKTTITADLLPALAAAMYYFIPLPNILNNNKEVDFLNKEYSNKKAFVTLSRILIVFLLLLTLGNFFWFNSFFKQQADTEAQLSVFESSMNAYEQLNQQLKSKEDFMQKSGLQNGSKISYYTDRALYDMPEEIQLNYFYVAPTEKRPEKDSVMRFDSKKLLIKGVCSKSIILNEWLKLLKTKDFVQDVILENYNQEMDNRNGKFDVLVKLK